MAKTPKPPTTDVPLVYEELTYLVARWGQVIADTVNPMMTCGVSTDEAIKRMQDLIKERDKLPIPEGKWMT